MSIKKWLQSIIVSVGLCSALPSAGSTIDKIIIFGDSLSDNGNVYNMLSTAKNVVPLLPLIPKSPPYFEGRFTNGLVWVEHLANSLNVPLVNYAYGGSWAEGFYDSLQILPPSLGMQVDMYSINPSTVVDFKMHQHLYVIWSGSNDYLRGRTNPEYATTNTVEHIAKQVEWLARMGAKHFVILNLPDISRSPTSTARGPDFAVALQKLIDLHNKKLQRRIEQLQKNYPTVEIKYIDIFDDFSDLIDHPRKYKLKNVVNACYNGDYMLARQKLVDNAELEAGKEAKFEIANNSILMDAYINAVAASKGHRSCYNPDEYLFWDKTHPTRIAHRLLGLSVFTQLIAFGISGA